MDKSVLSLLSMQDVNITNLNEASEVVKYLINKYSREEIIKKANIDKNVLYRLEHSQNVTLDNWLKIKRGYPELFIADPVAIGEIPIMGQIVGNKIIPLNPAQPKVFNAPAKAVEDWSPCIAYLNHQPNAFQGSIRIFSTRNIDSDTIGQQCFNRLVLMFPHNDEPKFGVCRPNIKLTSWKLHDPYNGDVLLNGNVGDKVSWWRWTFTTSLYVMENETSKKYDQDCTEDWLQSLDS
tara:strand:+ start:1169 stop:1876 length:708 start_codon:yes stop_codon:yes gene_type:complete